jgi:hypothetical protein
MKRVLLLPLIAGPLALQWQEAQATSKQQPPRAAKIAVRMSRALQAQSRIQVRGTTVGPGTMKTSYLMRYQFRARESMSQIGGPWGQVRVGDHSVDGVRSVTIGHKVFTSMDGRHWFQSSRGDVPGPLDALSLNVANAPCCVSGDRSASVKVSNAGTTRWHGVHVRRLSFSCMAEGYVLTGSVLIDPHSYLPLQYTQKTAMPKMRGNFVISYGGNFSISEPH